MADNNDSKQCNDRIKLIKGGKEPETQERPVEKTDDGYEVFGTMNYKIWKQIESSKIEG
jgi:hypothetical protein